MPKKATIKTNLNKNRNQSTSLFVHWQVNPYIFTKNYRKEQQQNNNKKSIKFAIEMNDFIEWNKKTKKKKMCGQLSHFISQTEIQTIKNQ